MSAYVLSLDKINYHMMETSNLAFSSVTTRNGQQMRIFATFDTDDNITAGFEPISAEEVDLEGYATEDYVDTKVADLVNSAPEALDTLGELATALENHEDAYDALLETIGSKATYDDLEALKEELSQEIATESDSLYISDSDGNLIFKADAEGIETTVVTTGQVIANGVDVGDEVANLFSELGGHTENSDIHVTLEEKEAWDNKSDFSGSYNDLTDKPTLFSGSYNDLTDKPDLSDMATETWVGQQGYLTSVSWNDVNNKPTFATVATTGDYDDLLNKPSLFSGNYNDLSNKPDLSVYELATDAANIAQAASDAANAAQAAHNAANDAASDASNAASVAQSAYNAANTANSAIAGLATVATTGSYNDLIKETNKAILLIKDYMGEGGEEKAPFAPRRSRRRNRRPPLRWGQRPRGRTGRTWPSSRYPTGWSRPR